ncbi:cation transporter [Hymenobacter sp. B1770]|uniref:cation transporter n=1 Tax=Hymenobacter sp. B1770 TaxID=1718788 RepID=UPI003CF8381A
MSLSSETTTLDIEGMTYASRASFVQKSLARTPGVQSAVVNYATEKATIEYLPDLATPAALKEAVVQAGYGVVEQAPDTSTTERSEEIDRQKALA